MQGPVGPAGAAGTEAFAFSLQSGSGPAQVVASKFAANEMRLVCGSNKCHAQVLVSGAVAVFGTDTRGPANGTPTSTTQIRSATPAQATLTEVSGIGENDSEGRATVSVGDGSAWQIAVELASDASGNVRLIGTTVHAAPTSQFLLCTLCS